MRIAVTEDDLGMTFPEDAILRAIRRTLPDLDDGLLVYRMHGEIVADWHDRCACMALSLPQAVQDFARARDGKDPVTPFEFDLDVS